MLGDPPRGGGVELVRQEPLQHEVDVPDRQKGHEAVLQGNQTDVNRRVPALLLQTSRRRVRLVLLARAAREQRRGFGKGASRAAPDGGGGGDALAHGVVRGGERGGVRGDVPKLARARRQQGHACHRDVRRDDFFYIVVVTAVLSETLRDPEPDEHAREVWRRRRVLHDDAARLFVYPDAARDGFCQVRAP